MTTEISPLQAVQENIKTRIKAEFANMIPDEMWASMISSVVKDFTSETVKDRYGRDEKNNDSLREMIRRELHSMATTAIKAELAKLEERQWGQEVGSYVAGEAMKKLVAENFEQVMASVQAGMVNFTVMQAVNQMRQGMMR